MYIEQHVSESVARARFRVEGGLSGRLGQLNCFFQGNLAKLTCQKCDAQLRDYHVRPNIRISCRRVFRHGEINYSNSAKGNKLWQAFEREVFCLTKGV
jgi:hypothetical protein